MTDTTPPAVWVDGDLLMEAIAAAVWEQCRTDYPSSVVDDPRNIAAVAATVARTLPASAVVPAADRAALSARLWKIAEHHIVAEWICCEPVQPGHDLCAQGYAALGMVKTLLVDDDPGKAWNPSAPLLDAVLSVLPAPADRAAVRAEAFDEAAEKLAALPREKAVLAGESAWKDAAGIVRHMAVQERRMANGEESAVVDRVAAETPPAETETVHACPPDGSGLTPCCGRTPFELPRTDRISSEADAITCRPSALAQRCVNCGVSIRQVSGTLAAWWVHDPDGHTSCHPQQADSPRATPGPAVEAQPGKDTETRCTCVDAGDCFAPAGHYADCPRAETPQPKEA
jgi:hypothetical protein